MPRTYVESWFHPVQLIPKGHKQLVYFFQKGQGHVHLESRTSTNPNKDCTKKRAQEGRVWAKWISSSKNHWNILIYIEIIASQEEPIRFHIPPVVFCAKDDVSFFPRQRWRDKVIGLPGGMDNQELWPIIEAAVDLLILRLSLIQWKLYH